jgi:hypothetical protein
VHKYQGYQLSPARRDLTFFIAAEFIVNVKFMAQNIN